MKTLIITLVICLLIYVLYIMLKIYNLKRKSKKLKIKYKEMGGVIKEEEIPIVINIFKEITNPSQDSWYCMS